MKAFVPLLVVLVLLQAACTTQAAISLPLSAGPGGFDAWTPDVAAVGVPTNGNPNHLKGRGEVKCLVGSNGLVLSAEVLDKSLDPALREALLAAAKTSRFVPGPKNSAKLPGYAVFEVRWE